SLGGSTSTAFVSHSDQYDVNLVNNTSTVKETPQQADLVVSNALSNTAPNVGDKVTYTISVKNSGPNTATHVSLQDVLPADLSFVSSSGPGSYDSTTGIWSAGSVTSGSTAVLKIVATVSDTIVTTDTASVSHADQY